MQMGFDIREERHAQLSDEVVEAVGRFARRFPVVEIALAGGREREQARSRPLQAELRGHRKTRIGPGHGVGHRDEVAIGFKAQRRVEGLRDERQVRFYPQHQEARAGPASVTRLRMKLNALRREINRPIVQVLGAAVGRHLRGIQRATAGELHPLELLRETCRLRRERNGPIGSRFPVFAVEEREPVIQERELVTVEHQPRRESQRLVFAAHSAGPDVVL